jgi:hypothetical protein
MKNTVKSVRLELISNGVILHSSETSEYFKTVSEAIDSILPYPDEYWKYGNRKEVIVSIGLEEVIHVSRG